MKKNTWVKTFPGAIMATDKDGMITDMNDRCAETYKNSGGYDLLGTSALACHKGTSLKKIEALYRSQEVNVYSITKNGKKKLIYQAPYFEDGVFEGMVELSLPIPDTIHHYNRDQTEK